MWLPCATTQYPRPFGCFIFSFPLNVRARVFRDCEKTERKTRPVHTRPLSDYFWRTERGGFRPNSVAHTGRTLRGQGRGVAERGKPKENPRKYIIHVSNALLLFVYDGETCTCKSENEPGCLVVRVWGTSESAIDVRRKRCFPPFSITGSLAVRADRYSDGLRTRSYRLSDDGTDRVRGCRVCVVRCYCYYFFGLFETTLPASQRLSAWNRLFLHSFDAVLRLPLFGWNVFRRISLSNIVPLFSSQFDECPCLPFAKSTMGLTDVLCNPILGILDELAFK